MTSILFVCLGNICRSPMAEAITRKMAQDRGMAVTVDSAGTAAYHIGKPPDPRAISSGAARGYVLQGLRARQVTAEDFTRFEHIYAMDASNLDGLERIYPAWEKGAARPRLILEGVGHPSGAREVPDPYYGGPDGFELVIDLLETAVAKVLDASR